MSDNTKHSVIIAWGEDREIVQRYSFDTKAELEAFYLGLNEGDGWEHWHTTDEEELERHEREKESDRAFFREKLKRLSDPN